MIPFIVVSISIPFLSVPAKLIAIAYMPLLLLWSRVPFRVLLRPVQITFFFAVLLSGIHAVQILLPQSAALTLAAISNTDTLFPLLRELLLFSLPTAATYALFLSLGAYLTQRVSAAQIHYSLRHHLPPFPGRRRIASVASLALLLFLRLRGTAKHVFEAARLRNRGRLRLQSLGVSTAATMRLGAEMALGTADALILRGYSPDLQPAMRSDSQQLDQSRHSKHKKYRSLFPELAPLLLLAAADILPDIWTSITSIPTPA